MFIPKYIDKIYNILKANSIESFVVGGCVRDSLLSKTPYDYDMCASSPPEKLSDALCDFEIIPTGLKHGTITVISDGHPIEITSYRLETIYSDFRHPDKVLYTDDIKKDLARRDFTINAMAYNKDKGLIDIYQGQEDIKNRIIRTVNDPKQRFSEDSLRILRALRFSSQLDFKIEDKTSDQIIKKAYLLENIAVERILTETRKLIMGNCACLIKYKQVLENYLSDYSEIDISRAKKTDNELLRFSFLYDNLNKANLEKQVEKMRFSKDTSSKLLFLKSNDDLRIENRSEIRKMLSEHGKEKTFLFLAKQDIKYSQNLQFLKLFNDIISDKNECYSLKNLAVNGNDLIEIGIQGREIGAVLNKLLNMVMENKCENFKEKLLYEALKMKF